VKAIFASDMLLKEHIKLSIIVSMLTLRRYICMQPIWHTVISHDLTINLSRDIVTASLVTQKQLKLMADKSLGLYSDN
jgi:hypothetical protein